MSQHVRIALATTSLNRSIRFYQQVMGLAEAERIGEVWARFQLDSAELWLVLDGTPVASSGTVAVEVHGWLEDALFPVEELGGQVLSPIEEELTARCVRIRDPDGNLVSLLQPAATESLLSATDRAVAELEALVREAPAELVSRRPRAKQPSIIQILAHVLDRGFRPADEALRLEGDEERFRAEWRREAASAPEPPQTIEPPPGAGATDLLREMNEIWARIRPRLPALEPALAAYRVPVASVPGRTHTVVERLFALLPNHTSRHAQDIRDILARLPE
jgi:predicted enzyme related to lactoylglutathione lyase